MADMLVRLTDLPPVQEAYECRPGQRVEIRRAMTYEQGRIVAWVEKAFSTAWADECKAGFGMQPVGCFVAATNGRLSGFCCYDCTLRGFAGPVGVDSEWRGLGIGRALLTAVLHAMKGIGYGYCVIGNVAAPEFFRKAAGAALIDIKKRDIYPPKLKI